MYFFHSIEQLVFVFAEQLVLLSVGYHSKKILYGFHLDNQKDILVTKNLKEYEKLLLGNFIRIHKSFLVNKNKIRKIVRSDGGYVVMDNQKFIPIGQKKEFFIRYLVSAQ